MKIYTMKVTTGETFSPTISYRHLKDLLKSVDIQTRYLVFALILFIVLITSCTMDKGQTDTPATFENLVDNLVQPYLVDKKIAGIAVGVYKGNEKLLLKSYGFADLEFEVPLPANASFQIGSITKQFTAAASKSIDSSLCPRCISFKF